MRFGSILRHKGHLSVLKTQMRGNVETCSQSTEDINPQHIKYIYIYYIDIFMHPIGVYIYIRVHSIVWNYTCKHMKTYSYFAFLPIPWANHTIPPTSIITSLWRSLVLMAEILHQLIGSLSHCLQGFIYPGWCRISAINRSAFSILCVGVISFVFRMHSWLDFCTNRPIDWLCS